MNVSIFHVPEPLSYLKKQPLWMRCTPRGYTALTLARIRQVLLALREHWYSHDAMPNAQTNRDRLMNAVAWINSSQAFAYPLSGTQHAYGVEDWITAGYEAAPDEWRQRLIAVLCQYAVNGYVVSGFDRRHLLVPQHPQELTPKWTWRDMFGTRSVATELARMLHDRALFPLPVSNDFYVVDADADDDELPPLPGELGEINGMTIDLQVKAHHQVRTLYTLQRLCKDLDDASDT